MILSFPTEPFLWKHSEKEAIKLIADAGFDAYDSSFCVSMKIEKHPYSGENYLEYAKEIREYADSLGIVCNQAHAPFPSSVGDPEVDEKIFDSIVRSMEIASVLGTKIIVVHPKQHLSYAEHAEELFQMNLEFYARLIPYCEKYNIKVATENMWQNNSASGAITDSTCSRAWEFNKYIDSINSEWITGCLDIGHVSLVTKDITGFIKDMGKERIRALHIHDTDFIRDSHTMPFTQKIDYIAVAKTLGEIGYDGDFTYESGSFFNRFPMELYSSGLKLMHDVGRYLISVIEERTA